MTCLELAVVTPL